MGTMLRATAIGLLNDGVTFDEVQNFVEGKLAEKAPGGFQTVRGEAVTAAGDKRRFIKFSRLMPVEGIDDRWNISLSHQFREAGYGDVAWKFTRVESEDPAAEDTTETLPPELFEACLSETDHPDGSRPLAGPFGSDAFWQWFESQED